MTNTEFAQVIAYITAGCSKSIDAKSQVVYFDLLGDLPLDVGMLAAKRVLLEHKWATFPTIAELREAAALTVRGETTEITPIEAWGMAWRAIRKIDLDMDDSVEQATSGLPPVVVATLNDIGIANLIGGKDPVPVVRAQFTKAFEQIAERHRRERILPSATRAAIEQSGKRSELAAPVRLAIERIGREVV